MSPNLQIAFRFLTAKKRAMLMSLACIVLGVGLYAVTQATTSGFEEFFIKIVPAPTAPFASRSLDELADTPGFREHLEREFPQGAAMLDGVDRRQFFKLMAASFALGGIGLAGCRRPESYILPYGKSIEGVVPGLPLYFATSMPLRKSAIPLLAETHQGRPTKLEGNPSYAPHGGASSLLAQASVLDLYDPDRATAHTKDGAVLDVAGLNDLLASVGKNYSAAGGAGLAFLAGESSSPTRTALVASLKAKFPNAVWAEYEPVQDEPPLAAAQAAFGQAVKPLYQFAKARRIVSLDSDFLSAESGSLYYAREFAKGRRVRTKDDDMNRLYVAESGFTITGGMADHRLRLASSHIVLLAAALACKNHRQSRLRRRLPRVLTSSPSGSTPAPPTSWPTRAAASLSPARTSPRRCMCSPMRSMPRSAISARP